MASGSVCATVLHLNPILTLGLRLLGLVQHTTLTGVAWVEFGPTPPCTLGLGLLGLVQPTTLTGGGGGGLWTSPTMHFLILITELCILYVCVGISILSNIYLN